MNTKKCLQRLHTAGRKYLGQDRSVANKWIRLHAHQTAPLPPYKFKQCVKLLGLATEFLPTPYVDGRR